MVNEALLMDLADCGSPERLLAVILQHHSDWRPPVDIETFAMTVGILEFRDLEVDGFVGALMTDLEKTKGIILSAAGLPIPRRRFTIAHELGHFLIAAHRGDKRCTTKDLAETGRESLHQREEAQANRFAAGLLMPKPWFVGTVDQLGDPAIDHLRSLSSTYVVSMEASANRYAELFSGMCAFVFIKDGQVRYVRASRNFPDLAVRRGDASPAPAVGMSRSTTWQRTTASSWIRSGATGRYPDVRMQVRDQANGFQIVLLLVDEQEWDDAEEEADLISSYQPRFR